MRSPDREVYFRMADPNRDQHLDSKKVVPRIGDELDSQPHVKFQGLRGLPNIHRAVHGIVTANSRSAQIHPAYFEVLHSTEKL